LRQQPRRPGGEEGGGGGGGGGAAAAAIDLDAALSPQQRANAAALCSLVCSRLDPATLATTWVENEGFAAFRSTVYAAALPWPLSFAVPWQERQRQLGRLRGALDPAAAYESAVGALAVLDEKLSGSGGPYLLGSKPCTADALLFGHALFWRRSPVAAPVLKSAVAALPSLEAFLARALAGPFRAALPPAALLLGGQGDGDGDGEGAGAGASAASGAWSRAARGQAPRPARAATKLPPTEEELRMRRGSALWLGGAAAALGAYVLTSGQFFEVVEVEEEEDDDDGEDDGEM
jgi:glutathione S-transferase